MHEMISQVHQKTVCFVSVAKIDEFSGGVDRVGCFLIRYFKSRGYRVISCYWRSFTKNPDYFLLDKSIRFPQDGLYGNEIRDFLTTIIKSENVDLLFDISFVDRIHEVCFQAKIFCGIQSILLYQADPYAYIKSYIDKHDELLFSHQGLHHRIIHTLTAPISYLIRFNSMIKQHRRNMLFADFYVVLSQSGVKAISCLLRPKETMSLCAIPNAIEPFREKPKKNQVVFVGRMDWQKRVDRLIRIWKKASKFLPDWSLVIVGDGPYMEKFQTYAKEISLKHYSFLGARPAQTVVEESSVLCLTSSHEGFGLTLVEAQSCGCVPIAFNSYSAIKDIIENGFSGVLVRPFSERRYAKELVKLCRDVDYRNDLSRNCLESAKRFRPEVIEKKWDVMLNYLHL